MEKYCFSGVIKISKLPKINVTVASMRYQNILLKVLCVCVTRKLRTFDILSLLKMDSFLDFLRMVKFWSHKKETLVINL